MKVLFISSGNSLNGISPIVLSQGESLIKTESITSIEYFVIKGKGIKGYLASVPKLKKFLKNREFDVIHAHYSLSGYAAALAGVKPLVVSLMGSDVKAKLYYKWMIQVFYKFFWAITIVKSEDMKKSLGFKKVKVIPNGVSFSVFYPMDKLECQKKLNWDPKKKNILFPSNPKRPEKNYELLIDTISLMKNIGIQVHTLVNVPHDQVPIYLNAADVIVLTSLWEGSSNALKEAMACNTPIVSTPAGDVVEVLGNTSGCYVVDFKPEDVKEKLAKALAFGKKTSGRNTIKELDDRIVSKKIINIYNSVVK